MAPESENGTMQLSIAAGVEFSTRIVGDRTSYVAHHAGQGKYYRFGAEEHFVASLIDGKRSAADIHAAIESDGVQWSAEDVTDFITKLIQYKIVIAKAAPAECVEGTDSPSPKSPAQYGSREPSAPTMMVRITSILSVIISQRFPLTSGHRVASLFESTIGRLFTTTGAIAWTLLVGSALAVVYGHRSEFHGEVRKLFDPAIWPAPLQDIHSKGISFPVASSPWSQSPDRCYQRAGQPWVCCWR